MFSNLHKLIEVCQASIKELMFLITIKTFISSPLHSTNSYDHNPGLALFKMQGNEKLLEEMRQGKTIKKLYHLIAVCEFIKRLGIFLLIKWTYD